MKRQIRTILFASLLIALGSLALPKMAHAAPATFTVNSVSDAIDANYGDGICETSTPGECTLRAAIAESNDNAGADTINFNIPGGGVHTITPMSVYETFTEEVTINGYSQPGTQQNTADWGDALNSTLLIEINGENVVDNGLASTVSDVTIRGLVINRFKVGISIATPGCSDITIQGNYIGTDPTGMVDLGNTLTGIQSFCQNTFVGGPNPADRNLITGNDTLSVQLFASETFAPGWTNAGSRIQGNYIGLAKDLSAIPGVTQGLGVLAMGEASEVLVGGTGAGEGNIIHDTEGAGVSATAIRNTVYGITIYPSKVSILGNSIDRIQRFSYPNFGDTNLGIDHGLYEDNNNDGDPDLFEQMGPQANDAGDADSGSNNLMNTPVLKTAQQIGNQLTITYDLEAADSPSNTYRVEFFASDAATIFGSGPGNSYLGAATPVTNGTNKTVTLTVSGDYTNKALSATTTAIDAPATFGFGSTSEFSKNISIGSATDFDSDGVADSIEDAAPNTGDGNNDGTVDRLQPTVTSFEIDSTGIYETLVTSGCSENGAVASIDVTTLSKGDTGKSYPYGLVDFSLNCSLGDTVNVTKYVFVDDQPAEFVLRKFNPNSETYADVTGSTISTQLIGDSAALVSTYSITDGGQYDDDGEANGVIVDPVGLATSQSLAQTGEDFMRAIVFGLVLVAAGLGGFELRRRATRG